MISVQTEDMSACFNSYMVFFHRKLLQSLNKFLPVKVLVTVIEFIVTFNTQDLDVTHLPLM